MKDRKKSVALEDYPSRNADEKLLKEYNELVSLRGKVNALIEPLRKDGKLGSSSEAQVTYLPKDEEEKNTLALFPEEELERIFIVSGFEVGEKDEVTKHSGTRCDRCWNYFDEIETDADGDHLCHRCKEAVEAYRTEGNKD